MKTQVTIELSENQRIAVGLLETGKMVPATRENVRDYVTGVAMPSIETATELTNARRELIENDIRKTLGMPEVVRTADDE